VQPGSAASPSRNTWYERRSEQDRDAAC
jgi:hypothetical protein